MWRNIEWFGETVKRDKLVKQWWDETDEVVSGETEYELWCVRETWTVMGWNVRWDVDIDAVKVMDF